MASSMEDSQGRILKLAANGNFLLVEGTSSPTGAGYATGCIFIETDGGSATAVRINVGNATTADFRRVITFPLNLNYAVGTATTTMICPDDTTAIAGGIYGRIAIVMGDNSTLKYIPVYYA